MEEKQKALEKMVKMSKLLKKYVSEKRSGMCSKERASKLALTVPLLEDTLSKLEDKIECIENLNRNRKVHLNQDSVLPNHANHNFTQFFNSVNYNYQSPFTKRNSMDSAINETCNETLGLYNERTKAGWEPENMLIMSPVGWKISTALTFPIQPTCG